MAKKLAPIHPGEVLKEMFLKPMKISAYRLAKGAGMPQTQVSEIVRGRRSITAESALLIGAFFGTSAEVWIRMQAEYDLRVARRKIAARLKQVDTAIAERSMHSA